MAKIHMQSSHIDFGLSFKHRENGPQYVELGTELRASGLSLSSTPRLTQSCAIGSNPIGATARRCRFPATHPINPRHTNQSGETTDGTPNMQSLPTGIDKRDRRRQYRTCSKCDRICRASDHAVAATSCTWGSGCEATRSITRSAARGWKHYQLGAGTKHPRSGHAPVV